MATTSCQLAPFDHGPFYTETDVCRFPVEPWNTLSLVVFLVITLYWLQRISRDLRSHWLIALSVPLLFVGTVGGAVYHACRCSDLWLKMDYLPIAVLACTAAVFFWLRLMRSQPRSFRCGAAVMCAALLAAALLRSPEHRQTVIMISYLNLAALVLLPAILDCWGRGWIDALLLLRVPLCFAAAMCFRAADFLPRTKTVLPMGTHFLWHIFGALAAFFLLEYVYRLNSRHAARDGSAMFGDLR